MGTSVYCVIGWPVHHSASPAMMNAVFADRGIDARYVPFAVQPAALADAVAGIRALGIRGANVTVPHKQAIMSLLDSTSEAAQAAGAVNLVRFDPDTGRMEGHNSDIIGWYKSVEQYLPADSRARVALLGAGGGARGILTALSLYAPGVQVGVAARRVEQTQDVVRAFAGRLQIAGIEWTQREQWLADADLVINATPIGMWPDMDASPVANDRCFRPGQIVQDIIYRPLQTRFLAQAQARGATTQDGLWMLVYQGAVSLAYWLNIEPPLAVMRQAALTHISG